MKKGDKLEKIEKNKKKPKDDIEISYVEFSDNNYWKLESNYTIDQLLNDQADDNKNKTAA